ncbi:MAG: hypothetical protein AAF539_01115 [Planctomycetota bacterium]
MFFSSRHRKQERCVRKTVGRRRLSVEALENRRVLAGLVEVTFDIATQTLSLTGDVNSNDIEIRQDTSDPADRFEIIARNGTRLSLPGLSGFTEAFSTAVSNVKDIDLFFDQGGADVIDLLAPTSGGTSELEGPLEIFTSGNNQVLMQNWEVETLTIGNTIDGRSEWTLENVVVARDTFLNSFGGETFTKISDSQLDGLVDIVNAVGDDDLQITDTRIGGGLVRPPEGPGYLPIALLIDNGDGRSITMMSSTNDLTGTVVHGDVDLVNGEGFDTVMLQGIEVKGGVTIANGDGDAAGGATVMIDQGTLIGTDGIDGGILTLTNGSRRDILMIDNAEIRNGMLVDNSAADTSGNDTRINNARIGGNAFYGNVIQVVNGLGNDSIVVDGGTTLMGFVDFGMDDGNDEVTIANTTILGVLNIGHNDFAATFTPEFLDEFPGLTEADSSDGNGRDVVTLENTVVRDGTFIDLGADADELALLGSTQLDTLGLLEGGSSFADLLRLSVLADIHQTMAGFEDTDFVAAVSS